MIRFATLLATGIQPTREILGNIPTLARWIFAFLGVVAIACFCWGVWRRVRIWRLRPWKEQRIAWRKGGGRLVRDIFLQHRLRGRRLASGAHLLLFSGFVVLLIGTILIAIEHLLADLLGRPPAYPVFHYGLYYVLYEAVLDQIRERTGVTFGPARPLSRAGSTGAQILAPERERYLAEIVEGRFDIRI